jgi:hypothetical protein
LSKAENTLRNWLRPCQESPHCVLFADRLASEVVECSPAMGLFSTAKLIGTPPGNSGHRETVPMLTQQTLKEAISQALVLLK